MYGTEDRGTLWAWLPGRAAGNRCLGQEVVLSKKKSAVPVGPTVDRGPPKVSVKTRTDCSAAVNTTAVNSPIWAAQPPLQQSGKTLIAAGITLGAADLAFTNAARDLDTKRTTRETALAAWNGAFDVYASNVETYAQKPEDVTGLALDALAKNAYVMGIPLAVELKYDVVHHFVRIHVKLPPGMDACEIEWSPDPVTATSFKRLVGHGVLRELTPPGPGTYWVHAATARANEQSAFCAPVSIIVP